MCAEHGITPAVIELCREFNRPSFQDVSLARERDSTRRTPPTATAANHQQATSWTIFQLTTTRRDLPVFSNEIADVCAPISDNLLANY